VDERRTSQASRAFRPGALSALLAEVVRPAPEKADAPQLLAPGSVVDRFELVKEIGRGGFGVVWEARDRELGRTVALKVLAAVRPGVRDDRLLREAEAAARLTHPNIVTLFDVGRVDGVPYLVLEFLRGASLAARLAQGPLALGEALRIAVEVAKGLAHAHENGVVHRDLTPGNVFLCEDGQVKILDFGMAHAFGRRRLDGGTPGYMAPEQVERAPEDERTDVFALGILLYQMLSGRVPYPLEGHGRWRRPPELEVEGHPALGLLVQRMLAPRPTDRPRDAGEVLSALSAFEKELARSGGSAGRVRRRRRAGPRAAAAVAVVVALGVSIAAAAAKWQAGRRSAPQATPSIAVLPFADLSPQHDQEYFADGVTEEILNALARVEGLRVPGRTSSFFFRGKDVELSEIGRRLNVRHVLEGSVRRAGDRVRITAKMVDVGNGYQLWSDTFEDDRGRVFDLQDRLAAAVVRTLRVKLLPGNAPASSPRPDAEAHEQLLIGKNLFYTFWPENIARARRHFERAVAIDPQYAPAWAFLSITTTQIVDLDGTISPEQRLRAQAAADRAIALAPDDAMGHVARAYFRRLVLWDWDGSKADVERALTLKTSHLAPYNQHALLLNSLGRPREAIAAAVKATEQDPLNALYWANLGRIYRSAGELDHARIALERALELSPDRFLFDVGVVELLRGSPASALELFDHCQIQDQRLIGLAMAKHDLGRTEESRRALEELVAGYGHKEPSSVAAVHAWIGEHDRAFAWLERAYDQHDVGLVDLESSVLLRKLREDSRYIALVRKMHLPLD
jgi:eukaryotic-like serine/threonine-protein kinase